MTLTDAERQEIRELLEGLQSQLERRMKIAEDRAQPVDLDEPVGRLSRMDAIQMQQMALAGLTREQERYVRVRRALALLDDEDFGCCLGCKQPIGMDRLRFQPEVLTCVRCA
ncbi:MAG: TraR/DksA family transcriptional regulator [Planctomycetota bacterium]